MKKYENAQKIFTISTPDRHDAIPGGSLWHFQSYFVAREIGEINSTKTAVAQLSLVSQEFQGFFWVTL